MAKPCIHIKFRRRVVTNSAMSTFEASAGKNTSRAMAYKALLYYLML